MWVMPRTSKDIASSMERMQRGKSEETLENCTYVHSMTSGSQRYFIDKYIAVHKLKNGYLYLTLFGASLTYE